MVLPGEESDNSAEDIAPPMHAQPQWADIVPEPVEDGGKSGSIRYMPDHAEVLGYFRALVRAGERSRRALELTTVLLVDHNSADYTAWQWRWECLQALGSDLEEEYEVCRSIALDNVKNYQLWNHRRKCMAAVGQAAAARELEFAASALACDAKNYHAWAHRQAVVRAYGLWEQELQFLDRVLADDVLNNSAWNQRMFVVRSTLEGAEGGVRGVLQREVRYVSQRILWEPASEAGWAYLRGLFSLPRVPRCAIARSSDVFQICRRVLEACPGCVHAMDTLALYYASLAAVCVEAGQVQKAVRAVQQGQQVVGKLSEADPLRNHYWTFRHRELQLMLAQPPASAAE